MHAISIEKTTSTLRSACAWLAWLCIAWAGANPLSARAQGARPQTIIAQGPSPANQAEPPEASLPDSPQPDSERSGYIVDVELPLVGDRDELVKRQIRRIADSNRDAAQRPVVVLRFTVAAIANSADDTAQGGLGSRGSQFER